MTRPKTTGRSYGHKMYMNTTGYPQSISRPADKDYDIAVKRPHSDDKKPYMDDEYPEMENSWTPYDPPNFIPPGIPDDPRIPPMDPGRPPDYIDDPDKPEEGEFTGCVFTIPTGPSTIKPAEVTFHGIGFLDNDPLIQLYVNYGPIKLLSSVQEVNTCVFSMTPTCTVNVQALDFDPEDYVGHQLDENTFIAQVTGVTASGRKCAWDLNVVLCPPVEPIEWDYENSAETIVQGGSATVFVTGGVAPYVWEVGDEEYNFLSSETIVPYNTLYASDDACGTANITVTDKCDVEAEGQIRNVTQGLWVSKGATCGLVTGDDDWYETYRSGTAGGTITGDVTVGGERQKHVQEYQVGNIAYMNVGDCNDARSSFCSGSTASPCLLWPSEVDVPGGPFDGVYPSCAEGRYARPCVAGAGGTYGYGMLWLIADTEILTYWEWECP